MEHSHQKEISVESTFINRSSFMVMTDLLNYFGRRVPVLLLSLLFTEGIGMPIAFMLFNIQSQYYHTVTTQCQHLL